MDSCRARKLRTKLRIARICIVAKRDDHALHRRRFGSRGVLRGAGSASEEYQRQEHALCEALQRMRIIEEGWG